MIVVYYDNKKNENNINNKSNNKYIRSVNVLYYTCWIKMYNFDNNNNNNKI